MDHHGSSWILDHPVELHDFLHKRNRNANIDLTEVHPRIKNVSNAAGPISSTIPSRVLGTTTPSGPMSIRGSGNGSAAALHTPPNWNLRAERLGWSGLPYKYGHGSSWINTY